jgi:hypothetical protein
MKDWRNEHEDALLERFREVVPPTTKVTILADRGFGDRKLYELLKDQLGFDFIIRFRGVKANTVKTRTHSLLNQGLFYFECLLNMSEERARPLMQRFDELVGQHVALREILGLK